MSTLDPERWRRLRPLLDDALELPAGERAADAAGAGEDASLSESAAAIARSLLADVPAASGPIDRAEAARAWIGRALGPYRVVGVLGEGGMGVVFEAEQDDPRRAVALKVVRGGSFLDDARLRLFRREIEALARLQHPGIASIFGAGRTDDGQHYFAMELVRGEALDDHLRRRTAPREARGEIRERVGLFLEVCDAIAYAHRRGVIHRDLKPSNLLVVPEEAASGSGTPRARVKVLDFGLARITDGDVALSTRRTELRAIEGTLPYMSPEQTRGAPDAIDTRSDVYSLGVVLFEMLTGERPYDVQRGGLPEGVRTICETPPRRPSSLVAPLKGDLDTILLKALDKDPTGRYASVDALADDLRRSLEDLPIAAKPPGTIEQLRKFARRHRGAAVSAAALVAALALGAAGTTVGMLRARAAEQEAERRAAEAAEEARTAESVSKFLVDLFQVSDPDSARALKLTARDLLEQGAEKIETSLVDEPRVRARLYHTLGAVHRNLGFYARARDLLTKAVALRKETLGPDHLDVASSEYVLAGLLRRLGRYAEAESLYRAALDTRLAKLGPAHRDVAGSYAGLANVLLERGDYERARPIYENALATMERAVGRDDAALTPYLFNLALLLRTVGDPAAARPLLERSIALLERDLGPRHPSVGQDRAVLCGVLLDLGEGEAALVQADSAVAIEEAAFGPDHPSVAETLVDRAAAELELGHDDDARRSCERAIAIFHRALGDAHPATALARDQWATSLRRLGRAREALAASTAALVVMRRELAPGHRGIASALENIGEHHAALGDTSAARRFLGEALALREGSMPSGHPGLARLRARLAALR